MILQDITRRRIFFFLFGRMGYLFTSGPIFQRVNIFERQSRRRLDERSSDDEIIVPVLYCIVLCCIAYCARGKNDQQPLDDIFVHRRLANIIEVVEMTSSQSIIVLLLQLLVCFNLAVGSVVVESAFVTTDQDSSSSTKIAILQYPDTELIDDEDVDHSLERTVVNSPLPYQYLDPSDLPRILNGVVS